MNILSALIEERNKNDNDTILRYDKLTAGKLYIHIVGQALRKSRFFQSHFFLAVLTSPEYH